jgi:F-type H+-transporting ATPase subunit delta
MKLSKDERKLSRDLFRAAMTDGRLDQSKTRLISQQIVNSKPRNVAGLLKEFQRLVRLEVEKHQATIESAAPLDDDTRQQLENTLRSKYGQDVTTTFKVTPELIGGVRVRVGSDVWDSSVRERLNRLRSELVAT